MTLSQWPILQNSNVQIGKIDRVQVPELDAILGIPFQVLDHGFVRVIDYMGNDSSIVQAARVSYGNGTKKLNQDRGLIRYLLSHWHTTPFEMCEIKFHIKLPIFVARQIIRHRTANVNEYSGRYSVMDKDYYLPSLDNLAAQSKTNKQGRSELLDDEEASRALDILKGDSEQAYRHYEELLNENAFGEIIHPDKKGLARELARMNLPINYYTQWYWKIDLKNLLHFLYLRTDSHAQFEIQEYARCMEMVVKEWVPITWQAWKDYHVEGCHLSQMTKKIMRDLILGNISMQQMMENPAQIQDSYGVTGRELSAFLSLIGSHND